MLFANAFHILVVTITEAFVFLIWIFPTVLARILFNVHIFTDFNYVFLQKARITDESVSSGV